MENSKNRGLYDLPHLDLRCLQVQLHVFPFFGTFFGENWNKNALLIKINL